MGSRIVRFIVTPSENEQIEALIKIPEENQSILHGVVQDTKGRLLKDAIVQLSEICEQQEESVDRPITHTFTDENGEFVFGPLSAFKQYMIKVWVNSVKIRELIIRPESGKKPVETAKKNKAAKKGGAEADNTDKKENEEDDD